MSQKMDLFMDATEVIIEGPKRKAEENLSNKPKNQHIFSAPPNSQIQASSDSQTHGSQQILKFSFIEQDEDFSNVSPIKIKEALSSISNTWKFITFADDQKSMVFSDCNEDVVKELIQHTEIRINNKNIKIAITLLTKSKSITSAKV